MKKRKKVNSLADIGGLVYSTEPIPEVEPEPALSNALPPNKQDLRVTLDKKLKGGKKATIVYNFVGDYEEWEALGKALKQKCGVGGTVKGDEIILQGNCLEKVKAELTERGYRFKVAGI